MLKKGVLRQVQADPLTVEVDEAFQVDDKVAADPTGRYKFYREAGHKRGIVVHTYEHPFLFLLQTNPGKPVRDINFSVPLKHSSKARPRG